MTCLRNLKMRLMGETMMRTRKVWLSRLKIAKMKKKVVVKKNFGKKGQSLRKNPFVDKTCFQCGEVGHIIVNCPNKKNDKNKKDKKNDEKKKKNG